MNLTENLTTEFKREYTEDIKKSVVAFANTSGGVIYIGINDDGSLAGVPNPDETILRVTNAVRDSIRPDLTLFVKYETERIDGEDVVKVSVEKGSSCPYYLAGKGIRPEGVYVRQAAASVPASETAILKMIKDTDGNSFEATRSLNQDLSFKVAEREFNTRNVELGAAQMKTLRLINNDGMFTNLALLLSDQCVHTIKLAVYEGGEKEVFRDRHEFVGSLLGQLTEAYGFIDRYNRVHAEVKGLNRIDTRDYPEEAVREALLNALVHREYSFSGSTLISIFDDRIEFVSIGGLVRGITLNDVMLGVSQSRNENLANVFYRLRLIEAYGTGMPKIMRSYEASQVKPMVETSDNAFKISLPNRNAISATQQATVNMNVNESAVMELLKTRDFIVRADVERALGVSQGTATRALRSLTEKGFINVLGQGKNTRYVQTRFVKPLTGLGK